MSRLSAVLLVALRASAVRVDDAEEVKNSGDGLTGLLATFKGKKFGEIDGASVCKSVGKQYMGYGMSMSAEATDYKFICSGQPLLVQCLGNPYEECCKGKCEKEPADELEGADATKALGPLLAGYKGQSKVDCAGVCKAVGKQYRGYGMSGSGEVSDYRCMCGGDTTVVSCVGRPFIKCCEDKCDQENECVDKPKGWTCPENNGCAEGQSCSGDKWREWVAATNVFRCMHDVPSVVWSMPVFEDTIKYFKDRSAMEHSDCYGVKAPAGPAGENLFLGSAGMYNEMDSAAAWYSEISVCGPFPGCKAGKTGTVGHFTSMIWQGDQTIGCFGNANGLQGCRYKALDYASCNTPNFGGNKEYQMNVFPRIKTYEECHKQVVACGLPDVSPNASSLHPETGLKA